MRVDVSSGVVRSDSEDELEYLMLESESDKGVTYFDFVGGRIEDGEEPLNTFLREFYEETGSRPEDLIDEIAGFEPVVIELEYGTYQIFPHEVSVNSSFEPAISDEHVDYQWMERSEIDRNNHEDYISEGRMEVIDAVEGPGSRYGRETYRFSGSEIESIVENFDI